VVSKDALMEAVWPGLAVTDDSLVQCIGDIRRALRDQAKTLLRTVPRRGYRLDLPAAAAPRSRRWGLLAAALVAALALAVGWWWHASRGPTALPAIAVLPFDDLSAEGDLAYLGSGVAEEIIGMLGRSPDLRVIARNSSFAFGAEPADIRRIGEELGVAYVLDGSVRREGDRLRIGAELADTSTGELVWSVALDQEGLEVSAMQGDVTARIVSALAGKRGALRMQMFRDAWARDPMSLDEYAYYLRAVDLIHGSFSRETNAEAARWATEGLQAFRGSPLLEVILGWTHWRAAYNFWSDDPPTDFASAARLAREVIARPGLTPRVALKANWLLAFVEMSEGNVEAAREQVRRTLALAPYDPFISAEVSEVVVLIGDYDEALRLVAFAAAGDPANADYHRVLRGWIYRLQGDLDRSNTEFQAAAGWGAWSSGQMAVSFALVGRFDEARAQVRRMQTQVPRMTQTRWRQSSFYADTALRDEELALLAAAGLPE
jgi:adenylate cyclase